MIMNAKLVIAERIPFDAQKKLMPLFKTRIDKLSSSLDVSVQLGLTASGFVLNPAVSALESDVNHDPCGNDQHPGQGGSKAKAAAAKALVPKI